MPQTRETFLQILHVENKHVRLCPTVFVVCLNLQTSTDVPPLSELALELVSGPTSRLHTKAYDWL